jgi:hypothetical protein
MSVIFANPSTYSGEASRELYSKMLFSASTLEKGLITVMPNVKSKMALRKFELEGMIQDDSCDYTPSGNLVLSSRDLEVVGKKIQSEICIEDLETDWISRNLGRGHKGLPQLSFQESIIEKLTETVGLNVDTLIWSNIISKATADSATKKVSGATTITAANVIAEMEKAYNLIPNAILFTNSLVMYVGYDVLRAYTSALGTQSTNYRYDITAGVSNVTYKGIRVEPILGITANSRIVVAQTTNLFFGTDLQSDLQDFMIIDGQTIAKGRKLIVQGGFKAGANYAVSDEVVLY